MKVFGNTVLRRIVELEYEDGTGGFTKLRMKEVYQFVSTPPVITRSVNI